MSHVPLDRHRALRQMLFAEGLPVDDDAVDAVANMVADVEQGAHEPTEKIVVDFAGRWFRRGAAAREASS